VHGDFLASLYMVLNKWFG